MTRRKIINIFLLVSIVLLILAAIRFDLFGRLIGYAERYNSQKQITEDDSEYPDHIYETFTDGEGKEISVKMEKKTGTIDGEEVIFYEDTLGSEVTMFNIYKGILINVNEQGITLLVDQECIDTNPEESFYEYEDIEDYRINFKYEDYYFEYEDKFNNSYMIFINTTMITELKDISILKNNYIRVIDSEFLSSIKKKPIKSLDFYYR
jgi:hypothetical protein